MDKLIYKDESYAIIGAAMEVHSTLGPGFLEAVYQKALEMEFTSRNIPFLPQVMLDVFYKGVSIDKSYIADFLVFRKIIVEIKSTSRLTDLDKAQVKNYLKATQKQLGILINFGESSLRHERIVHLNGRNSMIQQPSENEKLND